MLLDLRNVQFEFYGAEFCDLFLSRAKTRLGTTGRMGGRDDKLPAELQTKKNEKPRVC